MTDLVIEINGLRKSFGKFEALGGLDLQVQRGQVHGFLGPNGAGKSTTIRVLLGLLRADAGRVRLLDGDPWRDVVALHRRLAYVPGDVSLWPSMTGGEAIDLLGAMRGGLDEHRRADLLQRAGHYPPPRGASEILGLEVSGVISAVGAGVQGWQIGDPCVALLTGGGYAQYVAVPVGQVIRPPHGIDLITASGLIEVAATVVSNLTLIGLRAGQTFLVHGGTGGIGTFAIQYAAGLGARVFATAGSPHKLALCRELGATDAFDYHGDWVAALREAGLLAPPAGGNVIRLLPPLTATVAELEQSVNLLRGVLASRT